VPYETTWEKTGVYWRFYGHVTGEQVMATSMAVYGDTRFDNMRYQIVDCLEVDQWDLTKEQLVEIAAMDRGAAVSNPRVKVAVIATDSKILDVNKVYGEESKDTAWETEMFENLDDARKWVVS